VSGQGGETAALEWAVIRQDENGNHYRVGRYATRAEAEEAVEVLVLRGRAGAAPRQRRLYRVEWLGAPGPA
jgi:hypothetical protein